MHLPPLDIKFEGVPSKFSVIVDSKKKKVAQDGTEVEIRGCKNVQFTMLHNDAPDGQVSMRMFVVIEEDEDLAIMKSMKQEGMFVYMPPMEAKMLDDIDWLGTKFGRSQVKMPMTEMYDVFGLYQGKRKIEVNFLFSEMPDFKEANEDLKKLRTAMGIS